MAKRIAGLRDETVTPVQSAQTLVQPPPTKRRVSKFRLYFMLAFVVVILVWFAIGYFLQRKDEKSQPPQPPDPNDPVIHTPQSYKAPLPGYGSKKSYVVAL